MEFVHRPYVPGQTVAAIATPPGVGGIAVVRISGNEAISVAQKIFSGPVTSYKSHTVHYGRICDLAGKKIDEVLLLVMRGPRSFTGEDTVEIHCHGGNLIPQAVLQTALDAGAMPAIAGEFSFKAFMNGKVDLAQAEAIQAKIGAKNELALNVAQEQLEGRLSKMVATWQKKLTHLAAIFEAWVDFPEEDLEFSSFNDVTSQLVEVSQQIEALLATYDQGKIVHEGVSVCIVGSPNVGKSSLLNALLGKERAIVSPIAGTTRDLVEDDLRLNGLHIRLIDTAGIRETDECIEEEGIRRSKQAINRSDIVFLVLDVTEPVSAALFNELPRDKTICIWNKIDLKHVRPLPKLPFDHVAEVSAKESMGLSALHQSINDIIWKQENLRNDQVLLTSLRHKTALTNALSSCKRVIDGLESEMSSEFIAFDMRQALNELGTVIGTNITEDILTEVFSTFCIGK
jgi:tRNA modification GTPase